ncbi:hypothetical protein DPMN_017400 [Dreissena polymorpha]|uniref:Uncharacterized protein n=1 Tax=Dreissena polymorpha TaxID=45954 RepID=A0A9D4NGL4_DREPO|nr:hypothetical protein DPMN_017400 [Dreissena polymorpha]
MGKYYTRFYQPDSSEETDLPPSEYLHIIKLWDIWAILGDIFSLYGTVWIVFKVMTAETYWVLKKPTTHPARTNRPEQRPGMLQTDHYTPRSISSWRINGLKTVKDCGDSEA